MPPPLTFPTGCVWNRNIFQPERLTPGLLQEARHDMNPLSGADVFKTVATMSAVFLTEIALFIVIGMI
jgi:hypothetical protein